MVITEPLLKRLQDCFLHFPCLDTDLIVNIVNNPGVDDIYGARRHEDAEKTVQPNGRICFTFNLWKRRLFPVSTFHRF